MQITIIPLFIRPLLHQRADFFIYPADYFRRGIFVIMRICSRLVLQLLFRRILPVPCG